MSAYTLSYFIVINIYAIAGTIYAVQLILSKLSVISTKMARTWAMVFGWVLVLVGVLGFIPNPIVGNGALFHTDLMHNIIHIILGAALLWAAYAAREKAAMMLKVEGVIFLVLAVVGWFTVSGTGSLLGLAEVNGADHLLHLALGVVFLWAGWKGNGASDMQTI